MNVLLLLPWLDPDCHTGYLLDTTRHTLSGSTALRSPEGEGDTHADPALGRPRHALFVLPPRLWAPQATAPRRHCLGPLSTSVSARGETNEGSLQGRVARALRQVLRPTAGQDTQWGSDSENQPRPGDATSKGH